MDSSSDEERSLALRLGQLFGSAEAGKARLAVLKDSSASLEERREILQSFGQERYEPAFPAILAMLDEAPLRQAALRTLAVYDKPNVSGEVLKRYGKFTSTEKSIAIQTLATRRGSARDLMNAMRKGDVPRSDVSAVAARQMNRVIGPNFIDFWGKIESMSRDKEIAMERYRILLSDEYVSHADLKAGKALYEQTCASCHKLYGEGGEIGPDITGSNRANLDYILSNMLDPSGEIPEGYQLVTISTQDGRSYAGNVASEDDNQVTLRMIGQNVVLSKADILSRETLPVSMMPEGLLSAMSEKQVRDLVGYLRTTHPIE
jgi:putative heme-binding domain-containing protein